MLLGVHTATAQHCVCAAQLNWYRGGWHGGADGAGDGAGGGVGGVGAGPEGSTEHYNQSMCVGLMINPLSLPPLGGLGSSLYKGTSILLMFASKHLSPPSFLFTPVDGSPFWQPTSQNRTPGASEGSSHI